MKDFSQIIFFRTNAVESFLEVLKNSESLAFEHSMAQSLLDTFFMEFPEYQSFTYWIYQSNILSKKVHDLKKINSGDEPVPFYHNKIKLHLFKEIMNEVRVSKTKQDEYLIKIGILKLLIEIMCLRDLIHSQIVTLITHLQDKMPNFMNQYLHLSTNNETTLELKEFLIIYSSLEQGISKIGDRRYIASLHQEKCNQRRLDSQLISFMVRHHLNL
jgi:hypothetical protein